MLKLLRSDCEQGDLLYFMLAQKTAPKTFKKQGGDLEKWRWMDWEVQNWDKEEIPGRGGSMTGYILT